MSGILNTVSYLPIQHKILIFISAWAGFAGYIWADNTYGLVAHHSHLVGVSIIIFGLAWWLSATLPRGPYKDKFWLQLWGYLFIALGFYHHVGSYLG